MSWLTWTRSDRISQLLSITSWPLLCLPPGFHTAFLHGLFFDPEGGSDIFLRNVCWLSADYTALYPKRQNSSGEGLFWRLRNRRRNMIWNFIPQQSVFLEWETVGLFNSAVVIYCVPCILVCSWAGIADSVKWLVVSWVIGRTHFFILLIGCWIHHQWLGGLFPCSWRNQSVKLTNHISHCLEVSLCMCLTLHSLSTKMYVFMAWCLGTGPTFIFTSFVAVSVCSSEVQITYSYLFIYFYCCNKSTV
jgi:hypothetical protein